VCRRDSKKEIKQLYSGKDPSDGGGAGRTRKIKKREKFNKRGGKTHTIDIQREGGEGGERWNKLSNGQSTAQRGGGCRIRMKTLDPKANGEKKH